jgi:hypothetical protein
MMTLLEGKALTNALDGGVKMVFTINGNVACESIAEYNAAKVGSKSETGGHGGETGGMISNMSDCMQGMSVKKGDKIDVEAYYDMEKHPA